MRTDRPDWQSVMLYVSQIYKYFETWATAEERRTCLTMNLWSGLQHTVSCTQETHFEFCADLSSDKILGLSKLRALMSRDYRLSSQRLTEILYLCACLLPQWSKKKTELCHVSQKLLLKMCQNVPPKQVLPDYLCMTSQIDKNMQFITFGELFRIRFSLQNGKLNILSKWEKLSCHQWSEMELSFIDIFLWK